MAQSIVHSVSVDMESEQEDEQVEIEFQNGFVEWNHEGFIGEQTVYMSRDQALELRDKITEAMA